MIPKYKPGDYLFCELKEYDTDKHYIEFYLIDSIGETLDTPYYVFYHYNSVDLSVGKSESFADEFEEVQTDQVGELVICTPPDTIIKKFQIAKMQSILQK